MLHEDWAELSRYRMANAVLPAPAAGERRVVFMGDSITEGWRNTAKPPAPEMGAFFIGKPYINRGISGQTTPQMLVRFRDDVIALKPAAVVLLAGTNDLAGNTGEMTLAAIEENIATMSELARLHGIRVVLISVLPVAEYGWNPGRQPAPKIVALNARLREYARNNEDGVHPNRAGYELMARLLQPAIDEALAIN
jgi:lysophospholipase L1-like esterase